MGDVRVVFTKWGGRPHWEYDARRLGEDEHGTWLGVPPGTVISRPGASLTTDEAQVVLVPRTAGYVAVLYAASPQAPCEVYVDITTPPVWEEASVRAVDLDLDVLLGWDGRVRVEDEDELVDHRVRYGYPDRVVDGALRTCAEVRALLEERRAPFDEAHRVRWLTAVETAMMKP